MSDINKKTVISATNESRLEIFRDENGNILLTDDQKKAVLEKGRILVSASAGAGKTSTMIKRIILMVCEGVSLKDMLILVYNDSASLELKEKLHTALFKQACASTGKLREDLRKEIDNIAFCHISTIHSFCQTLIRENFDKLGVSPTFKVLDENAHKAYINGALDEVFAQYATEDDSLFFDIAEQFSRARNDEEFKKLIERVYALIEIQPNSNDFDECIEQCYNSYQDSKFAKIVMQYYGDFAKKSLVGLEKLYHLLEGYPTLKIYLDRLAGCIYTCEEIQKADTLEKLLCVLYSHKNVSLQGKANGSKTDEEKAVAKLVTDYTESFASQLKDAQKLGANSPMLEDFHKQNAVYVAKLVEIAKRFASVLAQNKLKDNAMSFEDLQTNALKLLESGEVATNYATVFVDEYQDVNPTQEAIICKVAKDECFFVGDVKQSIYGFRLADPSLFLERQHRYDDRSLKEGTNITFNRNFRSARSILKFVNDVFDDAMTQQTADINYKDDARFELDDIKSATIKDISLDGDVQMHLFVKPEKEAKFDAGLYDITSDDADDDVDSAYAEGMFIANQIKTLYGRACGDQKRIGYGDIAILFRSRSTGANSILDVLRKQNIPFNDSGFSKEEGGAESELMSMLYVIDNPRQDIALAGYLLSFFGGYDEGELAIIAQENRNGKCFYDKLLAKAQKNDGALCAKVKNTLNVLERYRIKSSFENVAQLMSEIVRDYCYDAYLAKDGEGAVYSLKSFIMSAQSLDLSLSRFLQEYKQGVGGNSASAGGDRVVVSTFHGFKGLERQVVFVADISKKFSKKSSEGDVILSGKGISGVQSKDNDKGLIGINAYDTQNKIKYKDTLSRHAVNICLKENQLKEETRLLYVALTRAQQIMYITATITPTQMNEFAKLPRLTEPSSPLEIIEKAICTNSLEKWPVMHSADNAVDAVDNAKTNAVLPKPNMQLVKKIEDIQKYVYQHEQATALAMKYSVSALDSLDDQTVFAYQEHNQDYAKIGTAYHKVMQHIDYYVQGLQGVEQEIERMYNQNILSLQEKQAVKAEDIRCCLDSDIIGIAKKYALEGKCFREQPFMMYKPACELSSSFDSDDKVLVQGVIDLFIDGDEKIIVDFKNSLLSDERAIERYKKQLYLYKMAVESAFCVKIDKLALYSFKTGKTHYIN